jgi:hypothetical protein
MDQWRRMRWRRRWRRLSGVRPADAGVRRDRSDRPARSLVLPARCISLEGTEPSWHKHPLRRSVQDAGDNTMQRVQAAHQ